ncbi:MAG TPA: methyltransferase domain-containing protein [Gemmatimonadaceae bacterium]|nr:methyltransferase domain-containing protein [Gemmatimonadaceae bacterium]
MNKGYVFDNAQREAEQRLAALPALYDPGTIRHLSQLGVGDGWRCLEIGAGSGTIAMWLGERVGATGHVLATDLDTRFLENLRLENVEVRMHNIESDPLPRDAFDLIHLRLVLVHLLSRERVLQSLVGALRPGGWLLAEEFDSLSMTPDPSVNPAETSLEADVVFRQVMQARGLDLRYGRLLPSRFQQIGLVDVDAEGRVPLWRGGGYGGALMRANLEQLRDDILATGRITLDQFERDLARLEDEKCVRPSSVMWAVWGRRPNK